MTNETFCSFKNSAEFPQLVSHTSAYIAWKKRHFQQHETLITKLDQRKCSSSITCLCLLCIRRLSISPFLSYSSAFSSSCQAWNHVFRKHTRLFRFSSVITLLQKGGALWCCLPNARLLKNDCNLKIKESALLLTRNQLIINVTLPTAGKYVILYKYFINNQSSIKNK